MIVIPTLSSVGEDIIPPPFTKIALRFARAVGGLAAARSRLRSDNTPCCHSLRSRRYATPAPTGLYGVCCFWCRGDSQCFQRKLADCQAIARGRPMVAPTDLSVVLHLIPVGEGSPLPTNLCKSGRRNASPTDRTSKFTTNLVGTDVLDGPKRADMESAPTDLIVVLIFFCRKGLAPHALPNAMIPKAFPCEGRGTACGG